METPRKPGDGIARLVARLLPDATAEEREEAEHRFANYFRICFDVYNDIKRDPDRYARFRALLERRRRERASDGERSQ